MSNLLDGSCCVNVIGKLKSEQEVITYNGGFWWDTISCWENLLPVEAMDLFENVESNYSSIFSNLDHYTELEFQLWDDDDDDVLLVSHVELTAN